MTKSARPYVYAFNYIFDFHPRSPAASNTEEDDLMSNQKVTELKDFVAEELRKLANKLDPAGTSAASGVDVHGAISATAATIADKHDALTSDPAPADPIQTGDGYAKDIPTLDGGSAEEEDDTHGH